MSKLCYCLLSLGCAKNSVDSQGMAQLLNQAGYVAVTEPDKADILLVNTCGFIEPAREESLQVLGELSEAKRPSQLLIAAGCLSQLWGRKLSETLPQLDAVIGTRRWMDIVQVIERLREPKARVPLYHLPTEAVTVGLDERGAICAAVQGKSAYLKIADGCRRPCAFCSIPLIKGTTVSRPPERILSEARYLAQAGLCELVLIAQDTTDYGRDLGLKDGLAQLLNQIVEAAPEIGWIRLMYAYPGYITPRLVETMAQHEQILPYLDLPLQHAHPDALRRMRRPPDIIGVLRTIERLRRAMPEIAIRTTFIVGYPGETEEEFETLLDFVDTVEFDHVGAFLYSFEPDTPSAQLSDQLPEDLKIERRDRLMLLQQEISLEKHQTLVGQTLEVLVEGYGDDISIGRSFRDAPEIDGLVLIDELATPGEIVPVRINDALEYDLRGTLDVTSSSDLHIEEAT